ncbi:hypothetical protein [Edaphobacter dinghuensis]|uniref:Uncharacterized protein n=1 Tax=Edaphobacter dinghuensis TaxID=1560005 RepID=A0A917MA02_9BACT|nr:hypothetical protein [Edaphobacter dinghuensis]GGG87274.1 hypothetical protein GCM10011585_34160 [Edaphobacter dinghuensis]
MRLRWIIPLAIIAPLSLRADEMPVKAKVETLVINPADVTPIHLRPGFISTIRMPEEINSIALGSRTDFSADHSEGEPLYVYVRPVTKEPAQSNLVIATKSGLHVTLELISDGSDQSANVQAVDFMIEYRLSHSSLIAEIPTRVSSNDGQDAAALSSRGDRHPENRDGKVDLPSSEVDMEFALQQRINQPAWTKWEGQQIETSIGDIRQSGNRTIIAFSILNHSEQPVEIVPPQVQIAGHKRRKKNKQGKGIIADQLEIRDSRLSETRLEAGARADGVVVFDRPNFKQSSEKLLLQVAQANQVDRPVLIPLPFTPPVSGHPQKDGIE